MNVHTLVHVYAIFFLHILFKIHQAVNSSNLGNIHDYNSTEHEMMFKKDILS